MPTEIEGCYPRKRTFAELRAKWATGDHIGTGDIEPPTPPSIDPEGERVRLRTYFPQESWEKLDERARESSKAKKEWLAERLAKGELRTKTQITAAIRHLGCTEGEIERQRMTPTMEKLVKERLQRHALYATAEAFPYQAEKAKEDVQSYKIVAQTAGLLQSAGVNVQTNIAVDQRNGGDDQNDAKWFENFQTRAARNLKLVEAAPGLTDSRKGLQGPNGLTDVEEVEVASPPAARIPAANGS